MEAGETIAKFVCAAIGATSQKNIVDSESIVSNSASVAVVAPLVAYGGVVCILLSHFPPCVESGFKRKLESIRDDAFLSVVSPENMGSKWAKISVAAPAEQSQWTESDVDSFREVLKQFRAVQPETMVPFQSIDIVSFASRSLSDQRQLLSIPLSQLESDGAHPTECVSYISGQRVLQEYYTEDAEAWASYRDTGILQRLQFAHHYLAPSCDGCTAACFVNSDSSADPPNQLQQWIEAFRRHLEQHAPQLAQKLEWFPQSCLHVTVRGLYCRDL